MPLVSRMVIQLTWQSAGENERFSDTALMGFPFPVCASPTVSRMVILLEWLWGLHVPLVSRMVIQLTWW